MKKKNEDFNCLGIKSRSGVLKVIDRKKTEEFSLKKSILTERISTGNDFV